MLQYDREVADEYDDYDEYEDEQEEDGEDEEYEEEERKPSAEELEYLGLRERLKQRIRKKRSNEDNSALTRSQDSNKLPFNNFGSFFGPSQPVLAQRVIQESKTLLENPHLAMRRLSNPNHGNRKSTSSGTAGSKQQVQNKQTKVRNELHTKVQKLKDVRDYSFLLSDDAELPVPAPKRNDAQRNTPRPNSEGRSIQLSRRTKLPSDNGKRTQNSNEERRSVSASRDVQLNVGPHRAVPASKPNSASVDPRRQLSSNTKTLQGRPSGQKPLPSRPPEKPLPSKSSAKPIPSKSSEKPVHSKSYEKPMPSKSYEKQLPSKSYEKPMPSKSSVPALEKRLPAPGSKSILPATHKTPLSRPQSSVPKKPLDQRNGFRETNRSKTVQPRPMTSSKPQINQAVKRASTQSSLRDDRPKKKPLRRYSDDEDDEGEKALSMIRRMFNTSRFAGRDDDDSDMEANFDDILREEQRSARIARQEDEEQLRLIEEEERREHMRKLKKQRW